MKKTLTVTRLGWDQINSPHAREHVAREHEGKIIVLDYKDGERIYH